MTPARAREPKQPGPGAKEYWQGVWADNYEALAERLLEATEAERSQFGYCPTCRCKVHVQHPDTRARTDAIKTLHELAGLRPKPESEDGGADVVVRRRLVLPDGVELDAGLPGAHFTPDESATPSETV
jgi:hypothetical protein